MAIVALYIINIIISSNFDFFLIIYIFFSKLFYAAEGLKTEDSPSSKGIRCTGTNSKQIKFTTQLGDKSLIREFAE